MDQAGATHREITVGARVAPPAPWVDLEPYPIPEAANPHFIANGLCVLLDDSQMDLSGPERAWFYRRAELVTAYTGAERAAQFNVNFDPAFEHIEIHSIAVIRGGERVEHASTAFFEVLRRERNMERLQFDGRLTIAVTLPDVRVGDVVETSYTAHGMRRSLGGRQAVFIGLEWSVGIVEVRLRQRSPAHRTIAERSYNDVPAATQSEADGIVDRRWRMIERPGFRYEALTAPWTLQSATLQLSEWRDWAEVVAVFAPLYEDQGALPDYVEQEVARIAQAETTPAGRAAAILRFTQGELRYLAISIGEGGYTPRQLADVCATRYGDCKDKSKLFLHMARRLGVDAAPALVNTRDGYALADWLPSGQLFDHCIVRVAIDGKVYWLDPTRQMQPSPLDKLTHCYFGWALPLREGVRELERMAEPPDINISEMLEHVTLPDTPSAPVRYSWEHTVRGARAEALRDQFAREGEVGVFRAYVEDIQRTWPKAAVVAQEIVSDDIAANTMKVREVYDIHDAWTAAEGKYRFSTRDISLRGTLAPLDPGERKHSIYLGQPGLRTRRIEVRSAMKHTGGWNKRHDSEALTFRDEMRVLNPHNIVVEQALHIRALTLPAKDSEIYRKVEQDMTGNDLALTETVGKRGKFVQSAEQAGDGGVWDFLRWIPLALLIIYWLSRLALDQ
jgi:hypothetical protein